MKRTEVTIGGEYLAKVKSQWIGVRIEGARTNGGWDARILATGKFVRIKAPTALKRLPADSGIDVPSQVVPQTASVEADAAPGEPTQQLDEAQQTEQSHLAEAETAASSTATAKKLSALDAAAQVLRESAEPMTTKQMIDALAARGLWTSPGGKTPHATLFSAILREISRKGAESRFVKAARGTFASRTTRA